MPEPDAAPLPRLGETFFDVRSDSRTMRLSWYADTGIAVFSIWQDGTCTGTFRLPMDELPRMIELLQRGPGGGGGHGDPAPQLDPGEPTAAIPAIGGPAPQEGGMRPAGRHVPVAAAQGTPGESLPRQAAGQRTAAMPATDGRRRPRHAARGRHAPGGARDADGAHDGGAYDGGAHDGGAYDGGASGLAGSHAPDDRDRPPLSWFPYRQPPGP